MLYNDNGVWKYVVVKGLKGDQGEQGPQGPTGPQGPQGPAGTSPSLTSVYPVGSIYMSEKNTSPASLFGGSWEKITNKFLYGVDADNKLKTTGGNSTHIHGDTNSRNGDLTALIGTCDGDVYKIGYMGENNIPTNAVPTHYRIRGGSFQGGGGNFNHLTQVWGKTSSGDNMPPWYGVYIWRRVS